MQALSDHASLFWHTSRFSRVPGAPRRVQHSRSSCAICARMHAGRTPGKQRRGSCSSTSAAPTLAGCGCTQLCRRAGGAAWPRFSLSLVRGPSSGPACSPPPPASLPPTCFVLLLPRARMLSLSLCLPPLPLPASMSRILPLVTQRRRIGTHAYRTLNPQQAKQRLGKHKSTRFSSPK